MRRELPTTVSALVDVLIERLLSEAPTLRGLTQRSAVRIFTTRCASFNALRAILFVKCPNFDCGDIQPRYPIPVFRIILWRRPAAGANTAVKSAGNVVAHVSG